MNILITGGSGYLASAIANQLTHSDHSIYLASRNLDQVAVSTRNIRNIQIDYDDLSSIRSYLNETSLVIHAAGLDALSSEKDPNFANLVNCDYTNRMAQISASVGVNRFVYISTAHVYRSPLVGKVDERTPLTNPHPYATSHANAEFALQKLADSFPSGAFSIRLANAFGLPISKGSSGWKLAINDLCRASIKENYLSLKSDPNLIRNFIPIKNAAEEILSYSLNFSETPTMSSINVGDQFSRTLREVVSTIQNGAKELFNLDVESNLQNTSKKFENLEFTSLHHRMKAYDFDLAIKELLISCKQDLILMDSRLK
jgi:UDP-glucose 4-epimerase